MLGLLQVSTILKWRDSQLASISMPIQCMRGNIIICVILPVVYIAALCGHKRMVGEKQVCCI